MWQRWCQSNGLSYVLSPQRKTSALSSVAISVIYCLQRITSYCWFAISVPLCSQSRQIGSNMIPNADNNLNTKIYVNPNFQRCPSHSSSSGVVKETESRSHNIPANAHINPLFLEKQMMKRPRIYMNPSFLHANRSDVSRSTADVPVVGAVPHAVPGEAAGPSDGVMCVRVSAPSTNPADNPIEARRIICKSRNRLIREPVNSPKPASSSILLSPTQPLVTLSKLKLVRKAIVMSPKSHSVLKKKTPNSPLSFLVTKTKYKLDNRAKKKMPFVATGFKPLASRYTLRNVNKPQQFSWKPVVTSRLTGRPSINKKLELLNINGLLYKSTRNKLQLNNVAVGKSAAPIPKTKKTSSVPSKSSQGFTIFVGGTKYVMDRQQFKLTRVSSDETNNVKTNLANRPAARSRIDIGGFTYVSASPSKNVLIRTTNHLARAYVHNAKQRSLHMLTKHLVKSYIPCPIYQRLGKCAAFDRGRCSKVHNKQQIAICHRFLRGECLDSKCLLSHEVTLSKMPVCKFFLQGICVRPDCPYLHKKLSNNTELCTDFLRGFCKLADKCKKRHEFTCPEQERNGLCVSKNCALCSTRQRKEKLTVDSKSNTEATQKPKMTETKPNNTSEQKTHGLRYFLDETENCQQKLLEQSSKDVEADSDASGDNNVNSDEDTSSVQKEERIKMRPKLGALPAFIPL